MKAKVMEGFINALRITVFMVIPICLCLLEVVQVVKYKKESSFLKQDALFYNPFISGTIVSAEEYNGVHVLKIRVKNVFTKEDGGIENKFKVVPNMDIYVYTFENSIYTRKGSSGLFSLSSILRIAGSPDYVGYTIKNVDDVLWLDDTTGEVIYKPESIRILDRMSKEGIKLDEYTVGTVLVDIYNKVYLHICGIVLLPACYFFVVCFTIWYVVPFIGKVYIRVYRRLNIRKYNVNI